MGLGTNTEGRHQFRDETQMSSTAIVLVFTAMAARGCPLSKLMGEGNRNPFFHSWFSQECKLTVDAASYAILG